MNDDLISRKATYEAFATYLNRSFLGEISSQSELRIGEIASVIHSVPTAFNKEKVIEELKEVGQECNECNDTCGEEAIEYAVEIVEKGGIR